ncbi:MAG: hypothetical protein MI757_21085 [Pirellulales bacterium]|nr:hypothetical protein [Pirellulales bacterium]
MNTSSRSISVLAPLLLATPLFAEPRVELELAMQRGFPHTRSHEVLKAMGRVGFDSLRVRAERGAERPSMDKRGTAATARFMVVGILNSRGEVELPGGTFSYRDRAGLQEWLNTLKGGGPAAGGGDNSAFGLTKPQFEAVQLDLERGVTFNTKGLEADEAVGAISRQLRGPLSVSTAAGRALRADKVRDELNGLTSGTALAAILRPAGCYFRPDVSNGSIRYVIDIADAESQPWPIGWPAKKDERKAIPKAFEWVTVELEDVTAADVLEAISDRLRIPFLLDHNSLALARIDPSKVKYDQPSKRTYYQRVLSQVLFKARLKSEMRVDERGKPFLWITTLKK